MSGRRIAVIGANGQLGSDLVEHLRSEGHRVFELTHDDLRVEDLSSLRDALTPLEPDLVLNTAAFHNVPRCEEEPGTAFAVNATGAQYVAQVAAELGAGNVYYSTDYVFDGEQSAPYREDDLPRPLNVYAASKRAGEDLARAASEATWVVRISGIYGRVPCRAKGENFITKMVGFARKRDSVKVVTDEILTPTPTRDIARFTLPLVESGAPGIYHLTCEGQCSWFEFTREIFDRLGITTPLLPATVEDFPSPVRRPHYSVLENARWNALGGEPMPHWREALVDFLERHPPA